MKPFTVLLILPIVMIPLFANPAEARPTRRDAVRRAFAQVDARGLDGCRVEAVADAAGVVRVTLACAPRTVVVVVRDDRVVVEEVVARPRPRPAPPPRDTVVVIDDDCDSDSDSDSDRKHHKGNRHGKHHDDDSDSDSD